MNSETTSETESILNKNFEGVLEHLSAAMFHATSAKAWLTVQNMTVFLYNILVSEMMNPFTSKGNKSWAYLTLICYNIVDML